MRFASLITCLLATMPIHATIMTVDVNDFAANSPITAVGASFSVFTNEGGIVVREQLLARPSYIPSAGQNLFGTASSISFGGMLDVQTCLVTGNCVGNQFSMLRVDFDTPTDFVGMRAVVLDWTDPGAMWAFRGDGSLIASCHFYGATSHGVTPQYSATLFGGEGGPCGSVRSFGCEGIEPSECYSYYNNIAVASTSPEIAYVLFGGYAQNWNRHSADQISYSVPEPSALGLVCLGIMSSVLGRRRQRKVGRS